MNFNAALESHENRLLDDHLKTLEVEEFCDNCRHRWKESCKVYKSEKRRPEDSDWCREWKGKER